MFRKTVPVENQTSLRDMLKQFIQRIAILWRIKRNRVGMLNAEFAFACVVTLGHRSWVWSYKLQTVENDFVHVHVVINRQM